MSTLTLAVRDSSTMVRRQLKRLLRYPSMTVQLVVTPVILLLLFVYVLGGTLGSGLGGGRDTYVNYVVPGILLMAAATAATGTAVMVATDMTEGIIARFRTMRISRASVLTGHVVGSVVQQLLGMAVLIGVAFAIGFDPSATAVEWLAAIGLLTLFVVAITWLSVALGLKSPTPEAASNAPMPLIVLPFLGSGFVPTDSMPTALRWFADYQPFTPIMETVRGLLLGTPIGDDAAIAIAWCAGIAVASYLWARNTFTKA
ncbi:ABC transporter permease [Actinomadura madurae]|uniref:ABC transporter permease n=1 Tax=Actinomadura madurae TaxID=1993 RepID=UPI0020271353|nr:ABC transporter permease [Actinomadura madurae]MCP9953527.1 ABC transporter permease [Actinomadura madurae]MCP9970284.1 ABC transporter permease [Actinomadura madurae]MCP9982756.1 ABC transporter permease [Actinomadura madurae]MCQ0005693.1 ABC transporter permease [Actinomadura madurae]MCQ0018994.1 ABC transporter permease [Actinomadura madurae]